MVKLLLLDRCLSSQVSCRRMKQISPQLNFFLQLSKIQPLMTRSFEGRLGGLGYNEFIILYHLSQASEEKMRRIDLANKVGLTASGITRLLLPMEKVGYIQKEANAQDARVSLVMLAEGGKQRLIDRLEDVEILAKDLIPQDKTESIDEYTKLITDIGKSMAY
jgi:DNA-binding MarR family transcriptional regulator